MAAEWLTISPLSGNGDAEVTVTAAEYTGRNSRTKTLKFKIGEDVEELRKVVQAGHMGFVTIESEKEISDNEEYVITGQSNLDGLFITSDGTLNIARPTTYRVNGKEYSFGSSNGLGGDESYNYEITIKINGEIPDKSGTYNIFIGNEKFNTNAKCVIKTPDFPYIEVPEGNIEINSNGGTKTIALKSNADWKIEQA